MSAPTWEEIKPRFRRMVLALGFRKAARRMHLGKSTLYNWFKGSPWKAGKEPIVPSRTKLRAMTRVLRAWEKEQDRVRTLKPAPVWRGWPLRREREPSPWTNPSRPPLGGMVLRYR